MIDCRILKIDECFSCIRNGANIKQTKDACGIPITRIETLSNGVFNRDRLGYGNILDSSDYRDYILDDGDVLMSHINSVKFLGRAVVYEKIEDEIIIHGMNLLRLVPIHNVISPYYANVVFKSFDFIKQISKIAKKAVNQASFTTSALKNIRIPVPPLEVQERIVAELDLLTGVIEKQKAQLKELDNLAQSIFYDMFGDVENNVKGWEESCYGEQFEIGSGGTPSKAISRYWENGNIPWIGSNMCQNSVIYKTDGKFITEEGLENSSAKILEEGTILVALVGATIGKVAMLQTKTCTNQNVAFIRVPSSNNFTSSFVFFHLQSLYYKFMELGGGNFKMANQGFIRSLPIVLPPLQLQQQFAERIEAIEHQKTLIKKSIEETQKLFDYTMDKYFG